MLKRENLAKGLFLLRFALTSFSFEQVSTFDKTRLDLFVSFLVFSLVFFSEKLINTLRGEILRG